MFNFPSFRKSAPRKNYRIALVGAGDRLVVADNFRTILLPVASVAEASLVGDLIRITDAGGGVLLELSDARKPQATYDQLGQVLMARRGLLSGRFALPRFAKVALLLLGLYLLVGFCLSTVSTATASSSVGSNFDAAAAPYSFEPKLAPVPVEAPKLACGGSHSAASGAPDVAGLGQTSINLK